MMKKIFLLTLTCILALCGCKNDDEETIMAIPPRDRGEEAIAAEAEILTFLQTHFYNYEEFENPPADFEFKIKIDTIAGDNANKTPLKEQVESKEVQDRTDTDVSYTFYYLVAQQGGGEPIKFGDVVSVNYEGRLVSDLSLFDSSVTPSRFDLSDIGMENVFQNAVPVITGFQIGLFNFNAAKSITTNPDGTLRYDDPGIGAIFIPSGLAYFNEPRGKISSYSQILFTFQTLATERGDQDIDGVGTLLEDLNGNKIGFDDDTDNDGIPNFLDNDDDGDGILTRVENMDANGNIITDPTLFPDTDNDGIPDYLDADS